MKRYKYLGIVLLFIGSSFLIGGALMYCYRIKSDFPGSLIAILLLVAGFLLIKNNSKVKQENGFLLLSTKETDILKLLIPFITFIILISFTLFLLFIAIPKAEISILLFIIGFYTVFTVASVIIIRIYMRIKNVFIGNDFVLLNDSKGDKKIHITEIDSVNMYFPGIFYLKLKDKISSAEDRIYFIPSVTEHLTTFGFGKTDGITFLEKKIKDLKNKI